MASHEASAISSSLWKNLQESWREGEFLGYNLPPEFDLSPEGWDLPREDELAQEDLDQLFTSASQEYEREKNVDSIFSAASQQFERNTATTSSERFEKRTSSTEIRDLIHSSIPDKTQKNTSWALRVWKDWAAYRRCNLAEDEHAELLEDFVLMKESDQAFWLCRFVCEVNRRDKKPYPPNTVYQLVCGLMRGLNWKRRDEGKPEVNFFENAEYSLLKATLDSRMKQLQSSGAFQTRKAEPISVDCEDILWKNGLLGDHSPQVLIDTLVFYIGMYRIVPSKRPWALVAHARKIMGGRLHGGAL
jgi:hypothetical protein